MQLQTISSEGGETWSAGELCRELMHHSSPRSRKGAVIVVRAEMQRETWQGNAQEVLAVCTCRCKVEERNRGMGRNGQNTVLVSHLRHIST